MPRGDPFSRLCQQSAALALGITADLHLHTTASDGERTASQIVALAQQARIRTISITDHDIIHDGGGFAGSGVRLIPGVEVSTSWQGRELHLLGYGMTPTAELEQALDDVRLSRRERYDAWLLLLRNQNVTIADDKIERITAGARSLGRRHLARLLVASGKARTNHDAFQRWLIPLGSLVPGKRLIPLEQAITLIHASGGVTSLAHPPAEWTEPDFANLKAVSLDAIEVTWPSCPIQRTSDLRTIARQQNLAITGGSDFHNEDKKVGSHGLLQHEAEEFLRLLRTL